MKNNENKLVNIFQTIGVLTEQDMDEAEIINMNKPNSKPKDARALHQQRAVLRECIRCYKLYTVQAAEKKKLQRKIRN